MLILTPDKENVAAPLAFAKRCSDSDKSCKELAAPALKKRVEIPSIIQKMVLDALGKTRQIMLTVQIQEWIYFHYLTFL